MARIRSLIWLGTVLGIVSWGVADLASAAGLPPQPYTTESAENPRVHAPVQAGPESSFQIFPLTVRDGKIVAAAPEGEFRFVVLSDTHIGQFNMCEELLRRVGREIRELKPKPAFVTVLGDLTMNSLPTDPVGNTGEHEKFKEIMGGAGLPVYPVMGNHDSRAAYRAVFLGQSQPPTDEIYYSFSFCGWHLIFLDTADESVGCSEEQRRWLRSELAKHKDEPVMIFAHHPMIVIGGGRIDLSAARLYLNPDHSVMLKLVTEYPNVRWVFHGHCHYSELWKYSDINFVSSPPTTTYSEFEPKVGYRIVDVKGNGVRTILRIALHSGEGDMTPEEVQALKFVEHQEPSADNFPAYVPHE